MRFRTLLHLLAWYAAGAILAWVVSAHLYLLRYCSDPYAFFEANYASLSRIGMQPFCVSAGVYSAVLLYSHWRAKSGIGSGLACLGGFLCVGFCLRPLVTIWPLRAFRRTAENPLWGFAELTTFLLIACVGLAAVAFGRWVASLVVCRIWNAGSNE